MQANINAIYELIKGVIKDVSKEDIRPVETIGKCGDIPKKAGLYFICKSEQKIVFKEGINNLEYQINQLKEKYLAGDKHILYIGKANSKNGALKQRIKQYLKYGQGKSKSHKGGRAIWQIENNEELEIYCIEITECEKFEKELLIKYKEKYKTYPVANWRK